MQETHECYREGYRDALGDIAEEFWIALEGSPYAHEAAKLFREAFEALANDMEDAPSLLNLWG